MTKSNIVAIVAIIAAWLMVILAGPVIWETSMDKFQGIVLALVITLGLCWIEFYHPSTGKLKRGDGEYDDYGDYIVKYYVEYDFVLKYFILKLLTL